MKDRTPAVQHAARPVVHYYPMPDQKAELAYYRPAAEVVAQRRRERQLYLRWKTRQAEIAERDRRNRHLLIGLGAAVGTGLLAGLAVTAWLVWHVLTGVDWLLVAPLALIGLALFGAGGHRCITIVQHWH